MKAYKQIRADIAKLEREAEAARKAESASVVAKIRKLAAEYGLTAADIGLDGVRQQENSGGSGSLSVKAAPKKAARKAAKKASRSGAGVAKYRDPQSGKTWTGFGRAPQWLASAKEREAFLIGSDDGRANAGASAQAQSDVAVTKSQPAHKAARKVGTRIVTRKAVSAGRAVKKRPAAGKRAVDETDTSKPAVSTQ